MSGVFDEAVAAVLAHEGGYVWDSADPGGETNFGISRRQYPNLDIRNLTADKAKAIYFGDYWLRYRINQLPDAISPKVLDTAVLCGPETAIRLLQTALTGCGVPCAADGVIGPATIAACRVAGPDLLPTYRSTLVAHLNHIVQVTPSERRYLAGWTERALA